MYYIYIYINAQLLNAVKIKEMYCDPHNKFKLPCYSTRTKSYLIYSCEYFIDLIELLCE